MIDSSMKIFSDEELYGDLYLEIGIDGTNNLSRKTGRVYIDEREPQSTAPFSNPRIFGALICV